MITINHLVKEVVLDMEDDKLNYWNQSKRVFQNLVRINGKSWIELAYPPFVQVYISTLSPSVSPNSLPSTAMEGANHNLPAQAAKPFKTKSKSTTSLVSPKDGVVKITKTKNVGKVKVVSEGEGTGVNQPLQKDKESEGVSVQPNHFVSSQKGTEVNKELISSLLAPSQKGVSIEKDPQPGT